MGLTMILPIAIKLPLYLAVGFIEMFLIAQRTVSLSKGRNRHAAVIVFVENFVSFFVFYQIISDLPNNWYIFIAYSIGSALGTLLDIERYFVPKEE